MTSMSDIRRASWRKVESLDLPINLDLPLLEKELPIRSLDEISSRYFSMHAVAASSYGFSKELALKWLDQEKLAKSLQNQERNFLEGKKTTLNNSCYAKVRFQALSSVACWRPSGMDPFGKIASGCAAGKRWCVF